MPSFYIIFSLPDLITYAIFEAVKIWKRLCQKMRFSLLQGKTIKLHDREYRAGRNEFTVVVVKLFSHVWLFATPWMASCQAPLSMGLPRPWVAISFCRVSFWPRDWTHVSYIGRWILYHRVTSKVHTSSHMCLVLALRRVDSKTKIWTQGTYLESDSQSLEEEGGRVMQGGRKANKGFHCPGFLWRWVYKLSVCWWPSETLCIYTSEGFSWQMRNGACIWDISPSQELMFLHFLTTRVAGCMTLRELKKALSPQTRQVHAWGVTLAESMELSTRATLKSKSNTDRE